ncbi:MAG TPA: alpha/beta hydrolase [Candidatus Angelobacter sp.]|nr:alpha/beta hydrolase [Candidatus Angelobacter sp.]
MKLAILWLGLFLPASLSLAQAAPKAQYPVQFFSTRIEDQDLRMAYRDVAPSSAANGTTVLLLHGKNFSGYYWEGVIARLTERGYRVVAPDQIGFGASSRPGIHYSLISMAATTLGLLDKLGISRVVVVGHSMGGMVAVRFALLYPGNVAKLVLEDPIGLEDYRTFVPYASIDELYAGELKATYESFLNYQKSYYHAWKPQYEQYVQDQAWVLGTGEYPRAAMASALTSEMVYEQPVCYEFSRLKVPTLLIVGHDDRTVPGKARLSAEAKAAAGDYPRLGEKTHEQIPGSRLVEIPDCGHIPHIEQPEAFAKALLNFLGN